MYILILLKKKAGSNLNVSEGKKKSFRNNFMKFHLMKCFYKFGVSFTCMPLARALSMFKSFTYTKTHIKRVSNYPHSSLFNT